MAVPAEDGACAGDEPLAGLQLRQQGQRRIDAADNTDLRQPAVQDFWRPDVGDQSGDAGRQGGIAGGIAGQAPVHGGIAVGGGIEIVAERRTERRLIAAVDIDILNEIGGDEIAQHTIAVQQEGATVYEGGSFTFKGYEALPEGYLALPFVMFAQAISLLNSVRVGNTPDTPSPTGTVNRVVKGVTIHPFTA